MDKYIFPTIFESGEKHGYCVTFPDGLMMLQKKGTSIIHMFYRNH